MQNGQRHRGHAQYRQVRVKSEAEQSELGSGTHKIRGTMGKIEEAAAGKEQGCSMRDKGGHVIGPGDGAASNHYRRSVFL